MILILTLLYRKMNLTMLLKTNIQIFQTIELIWMVFHRECQICRILVRSWRAVQPLLTKFQPQKSRIVCHCLTRFCKNYVVIFLQTSMTKRVTRRRFDVLLIQEYFYKVSHFKFMDMSFVLTNASTIFMKSMNYVFQKLLDDLLAFFF